MTRNANTRETILIDPQGYPWTRQEALNAVVAGVVPEGFMDELVPLSWDDLDSVAAALTIGHGTYGPLDRDVDGEDLVIANRPDHVGYTAGYHGYGRLEWADGWCVAHDGRGRWDVAPIEEA